MISLTNVSSLGTNSIVFGRLRDKRRYTPKASTSTNLLVRQFASEVNASNVRSYYSAARVLGQYRRFFQVLSFIPEPEKSKVSNQIRRGFRRNSRLRFGKKVNAAITEGDIQLSQLIIKYPYKSMTHQFNSNPSLNPVEQETESPNKNQPTLS